jgi:hypothetical protein
MALDRGQREGDRGVRRLGLGEVMAGLDVAAELNPIDNLSPAERVTVIDDCQLERVSHICDVPGGSLDG